MNELVLTKATAESGVLPTPYELNNMSTQHLRGELARSLTMSAQHLAYLAVIWGALESRGEDLSDLRIGLAVYLPQIASGQLDAEVVIRFAGQPTVLRNIAALPIETQRGLAKGVPVRVLTVDVDGTYQSAEMPAYALTGAQAKLVFDSGKLRDPNEQRAILETARVTAKKRTRPGGGGHVRYDATADVLRIGRASATVGEVMGALTLAAPSEEATDELDKVILVKVTEAEHRMFKTRAAESGLDMQVLSRRILVGRLVL